MDPSHNMLGEIYYWIALPDPDLPEGVQLIDLAARHYGLLSKLKTHAEPEQVLGPPPQT
jgi:hypothetical protein